MALVNRHNVVAVRCLKAGPAIGCQAELGMIAIGPHVWAGDRVADGRAVDPPKPPKLLAHNRSLKAKLRAILDVLPVTPAARIRRKPKMPAARPDAIGRCLDHFDRARPLRRVIQYEVEDKLSDGFLSGKFKPGDTVLIDLLEGNLDFRVVQAPEQMVEEPVLA